MINKGISLAVSHSAEGCRSHSVITCNYTGVNMLERFSNHQRRLAETLVNITILWITICVANKMIVEKRLGGWHLKIEKRYVCTPVASVRLTPSPPSVSVTAPVAQGKLPWRPTTPTAVWASPSMPGSEVRKRIVGRPGPRQWEAERCGWTAKAQARRRSSSL